MTPETITFGFLYSLSRRDCVHPNSFVQGLAVAAGLDGRHQEAFRRHLGKLASHVAAAHPVHHSNNEAVGRADRRCAIVEYALRTYPRSCEGGQSMSEAPGPTEPADHAVAALFGRRRQRGGVAGLRHTLSADGILRWCRRPQAGDDAEEVASAGAVQAGRLAGPRGVPAAPPRHLPRLAEAGGRQRGRGPRLPARRWPAGRRHPALLARPRPSIDELAGELDEEFRADCERARARVCTASAAACNRTPGSAFTRTYLQGQEVREVACELGLTLSGVYKARDPGSAGMLEVEGQAESLPSVKTAPLP